MRRAAIVAFGLLSLLVPTHAWATALLKGEIRANEMGGSLVPNLRIRANGANPSASDTAGQFVLEFPQLQPGDTTKVSIIRDGWAVVNDVELERELPANPERRILTILISRASERQQWALQYYRLRGREVVDAEYERKLQELQTAGAQERERLQRERDQARAQADELARQLSEAKPGDVGIEVRRAQQLFLEGQIDQALQLVSEVRLKQQAAQAEKALAQAVQGYLLRGKLLAVKFQFNEAATAYGEAARLAPNDGTAQFEYAYFNQSLNRFGPARQGYERALAIWRQQAEANPETYRPAVATTLNNLGVLHWDQNRYAEARAAYEEALAIQRELAKSNPETYRPDVAQTLNNLGNLHSDQHRDAEARAAYDEALAIERALAKSNPETYRPVVARTLNNLGILHADQNRYPEARAAYEEALAIRRELAKSNPETYRPAVADTLNNLGNLHRNQNRDAEARAAYEEALAIYTEFGTKNHERFGPEVARVQQLIGGLKK
jgi:tetratricopeptide (TPR) repeat protein